MIGVPKDISAGEFANVSDFVGMLAQSLRKYAVNNLEWIVVVQAVMVQSVDVGCLILLRKRQDEMMAAKTLRHTSNDWAVSGIDSRKVMHDSLDWGQDGYIDNL